MKTVVTGGAGFIGHHLVKALLDRGDDVVVLDNFAGGEFPERLHRKANYYEIDIAETLSLQSYFAEATRVFHLAALPRVQYSIEHPADSERVNVFGTLRVLEAAHAAKVRRVMFASSSSVYGEPVQMPIREDMPLNPMSPYAAQKASGEWYCRFYAEVKGLQTVCLRFFNVYGPNADPSGAYALVVAKFIDQRVHRRPVTIAGDGTQTRDFTHVSDVVKAMICASTNPNVGKGEALNVGGGRQVSVNEVASLIGGPSIHIPPRLEPHDSLADISKAGELLGWQPQVPFDEGISNLKQMYGL